MNMKIFQKAKNKTVPQICTQTSPSNASVFTDIENQMV